MTAVNNLPKRKKWAAAGTAVVLLLCLTAIALQPPMSVNGYAVSAKEYDLFAANFPNDSNEQLQDQIVRAKCIQIWAVDEELVSKAWVNRSVKQEHSRSPYGPSRLTQWDAHTYTLSQLETQIKEKIAQKATESQLRAYYDRNLESYRRADSVDAQCILWEDGRAVSSTEISIDAQTVRIMTEANQPLAEALLNLTVGETSVVSDASGGYLQLICTALTPGGYDAFEDVMQAVEAQYAQECYTLLLEQRVAGATIT